MWIKKSDILKLSDDIRRSIDGIDVDFRDNEQNAWSMLKNDIHTLANHKFEQVDSLNKERNIMAETLANISHQLKTPITSTMIMADLLQEVPEEKQTEFIYNIKIAVSQMEWLVSNLLKMAKIDAGVVEFDKSSTSSNELLSDAIKPLQILLELKGQEIEIKGEIELECDRLWTVEAITNILKNASEHSPSNTVITVDTGVNPISSWISISDSGYGIPFDEMGNLFDRFEGVRSDSGYGIGLPLALSIMKGQNGDIEVDGGGRGAGAKFTLKFFK